MTMYLYKNYSNNIIMSELALGEIFVETKNMDLVKNEIFSDNNNYKDIVIGSKEHKDLFNKLSKKDLLITDFNKKYIQKRIENGLRRILLTRMLKTNFLPAGYAIDLTKKYNKFLIGNHNIQAFNATGYIEPDFSRDQKNSLLEGYGKKSKEIPVNKRQEIYNEFKKIALEIENGTFFENNIREYIKYIQENN